MICPNCRTDNRDRTKYCDECGFSLAVFKSRYSKNSFILGQYCILKHLHKLSKSFADKVCVKFV